MISYVGGFLFNVDGTRLALVQKIKPDWQNGFLNAVGGKIEIGEDPMAAMIREFREETGVYYPDWKPVVRMHNDASHQEDYHHYEVFFYVGHSHIVESCCTVEAETIHVVDIKPELYPRCLSNLAWLIPMAADPNVIRYGFSQIAYKDRSSART
jgi:8-oxo-dGTP diphosphatase